MVELSESNLLKIVWFLRIFYLLPFAGFKLTKTKNKNKKLNLVRLNMATFSADFIIPYYISCFVDIIAVINDTTTFHNTITRMDS